MSERGHGGRDGRSEGPRGAKPRAGAPPAAGGARRKGEPQPKGGAVNPRSRKVTTQRQRETRAEAQSRQDAMQKGATARGPGAPMSAPGTAEDAPRRGPRTRTAEIAEVRLRFAGEKVARPERDSTPARRPSRSTRAAEEGGAGKKWDTPRGARPGRTRETAAKGIKVPPPEPMRIQRALARGGIASRRQAEELVNAGRVTVNGAVATIGQSVDVLKDVILIDGKRLAPPARRAQWFVLHKPSGVLTTRKDPEGRKTVFDLVPDAPGLTYIGRLDYMTEGVLILTTDGAAAHALTHPSREVPRSYVATVRGNAGAAAKDARRDGIELEEGPVEPMSMEVVPLGKGRWELHLTITEGRNREVRRICEAMGLEVERLVRTQFGPIMLGALAPGQSRAVSASEHRELAALMAAPTVEPDGL